MNTSIHISTPTTDLVMGLVDQRDTHLEISVLANLDIPPQHDQVGKGGATLHALQGEQVLVSSLETDLNIDQHFLYNNTSHRARFETRIRLYRRIFSSIIQIYLSGGCW